MGGAVALVDLHEGLQMSNEENERTHPELQGCGYLAAGQRVACEAQGGRKLLVQDSTMHCVGDTGQGAFTVETGPEEV